MCLLGVPKNLHLDATFLQNENFWPILTRLRNFHVKKALTMKMLITLNRHRSPVKVVLWIGKSGSEISNNIGSPATTYLQVVKGSRDLLLKFWSLSISRERLELETSNFVPQCKMPIPVTINRRNRNRKYSSNMVDVRCLNTEVVISHPWIELCYRNLVLR